MRFRKYVAALAAGVLLVPAVSSAAITLTPSGQLQLAQLATQLVSILGQISQAQSLGSAYTNSADFQTQAAQWTVQLTQIQAQLVTLLSTSVQTAPTTPTYVPTLGDAGDCPNLYRDLEEGAQGSDVAALQLFLAKDTYARFTGGVDGIFDAATSLAVQRYQAGYGIVYYGSPSTTGYGRVGPGTRKSIAANCAHSGYITSVPPITVPISQVPTPTNPVPTPTPIPNYPPPSPITNTVPTNYSTGQLSIVPGSVGQSGGPTSVTFSVNMLPNSACSASAFILAFGDGQQQAISSSATCGNQVVQIAHVYASTGSYNATLTSGTFQTQLAVNVQQANNTIALSATADPNISFAAVLTATYNPGSTCAAGSYKLDFGDGNTQNISFPSSPCSSQTQTFSHTYAQSQTYFISASDAFGKTVGINFFSRAVSAAGAGDPFQVLMLHGEGANASTAIVDSSPKAHAFTPGGNVHIETSKHVVGGGSIRLDGSSYASTPSSDDFNFGTGPFTLDLWFSPHVFPAINTQAALVMQAGPNAADTSLGGAGLELFGDKLYFVGNIGGVTYHPFYNNSPHTDSLTADAWYHAAVVRSGSTITLYLNGVSKGTITVSGAANASTNALTLGRYGEFGGNFFNGWIDELDIAKGTARWTQNFNPATLGGVPTSIADDLAWSSSGQVANKSHCLNITEPSDSRWTTNNYLCSNNDYGLQWSSNGPISNMVCTLINEPSASASANWSNNYLCSNVNYGFVWSSSGAVSGLRCTQISEPNEPASSGWSNNFLCYP